MTQELIGPSSSQIWARYVSPSCAWLTSLADHGTVGQDSALSPRHGVLVTPTSWELTRIAVSAEPCPSFKTTRPPRFPAGMLVFPKSQPFNKTSGPLFGQDELPVVKPVPNVPRAPLQSHGQRHRREQPRLFSGSQITEEAPGPYLEIGALPRWGSVVFCFFFKGVRLLVRCPVHHDLAPGSQRGGCEEQHSQVVLESSLPPSRQRCGRAR